MNRYGTTPLVWACRAGHAGVVSLLLEAGARVETAGMYSWTPLSEAAKERNNPFLVFDKTMQILL